MGISFASVSLQIWSGVSLQICSVIPWKAAAATKSGTSDVEQKAAETDKENTRLKEQVAGLEKRKELANA